MQLLPVPALVYYPVLLAEGREYTLEQLHTPLALYFQLPDSKDNHVCWSRLYSEIGLQVV